MSAGGATASAHVPVSLTFFCVLDFGAANPNNSNNKTQTAAIASKPQAVEETACALEESAVRPNGFRIILSQLNDFRIIFIF